MCCEHFSNLHGHRTQAREVWSGARDSQVPKLPGDVVLWVRGHTWEIRLESEF